MALGYDRPEITTPPDPAPACCTQKTLTVPVTINASPSTPKPAARGRHQEIRTFRTFTKNLEELAREHAASEI